MLNAIIVRTAIIVRISMIPIKILYARIIIVITDPEWIYSFGRLHDSNQRLNVLPADFCPSKVGRFSKGEEYFQTIRGYSGILGSILVSDDSKSLGNSICGSDDGHRYAIFPEDPGVIPQGEPYKLCIILLYPTNFLRVLLFLRSSPATPNLIPLVAILSFVLKAVFKTTFKLRSSRQCRCAACQDSIAEHSALQRYLKICRGYTNLYIYRYGHVLSQIGFSGLSRVI